MPGGQPRGLRVASAADITCESKSSGLNTHTPQGVAPWFNCGKAYLVYESGAAQYVAKNPRNVIPGMHTAPIARLTSYK